MSRGEGEMGRGHEPRAKGGRQVCWKVGERCEREESPTPYVTPRGKIQEEGSEKGECVLCCSAREAASIPLAHGHGNGGGEQGGEWCGKWQRQRGRGRGRERKRGGGVRCVVAPRLGRFSCGGCAYEECEAASSYRESTHPRPLFGPFADPSLVRLAVRHAAAAPAAPAVEADGEQGGML